MLHRSGLTLLAFVRSILVEMGRAHHFGLRFYI